MYRIPQDHDCGGKDGCRDCESCAHKKKQKGLSTEEADQLLRNAALGVAQILISQRERNTMEDFLLPAGINSEETKEDDEKALQALQEEADREVMLLPAPFNGTAKSATKQKESVEDLLLPAGLN